MVASIIAMVVACFTPLIRVIYGIPLAVIALVCIIGLGGQYAFGGTIPFFNMNIPCVAGAAIAGIILNLILTFGDKATTE